MWKTVTTTSMLGDPEGAPLMGESSGSFFPHLSRALCAETPNLPADAWVPSYESPTIPAELAEVCDQCPGRQDCLLWALATEAEGYWAGTSTSDRRRMSAVRAWTVDEADRLRRDPGTAPVPLHPAGDGSEQHYRRDRCRCFECRSAHAATRRTERAAA